MKNITALFFALCSGCSFFFEQLATKDCQQETPRCDGSILIRCEEGAELSIDCRIEDRCHEEFGGFCGSCGDGVVQLTLDEQCDDANANNLDDCTTLCRASACGDGFLQAGELCDDGNVENFDSCRNNCTFPFCGDGLTDLPIEECDDLNHQDGDGCESDCTRPPCGTAFGAPSCNPNPSCGDGVLQAGEECDDQNRNNLDGCSADCFFPICGDGIFERFAGEECDDGNTNNGDNCSSLCQLPLCGNATINALEQCDDGNLVNGDACDNNCTLPACFNGEDDPGELCLFGSELALGARLPRALVLQDINNDGALDLFNCNFDDLFVSLHLGDGSGFFLPPQNIPNDLSGAREIAIGDFNGDSQIDIFTGTDDEGLKLSLVLGQPGGFAPPQLPTPNGLGANSSDETAVADLDNDGDDDLVSGIGIFFGGAAPFSAPSFFPEALFGANAVELIDADQDGLLDVAAASFDGVQLFRGLGNASFANAQLISNAHGFLALASADVDQSGTADLVMLDFDTTLGPGIAVLLGNGDGTFQAAQHFDSPSTGSALALGDINGDGLVDAAISIENGGDGRLGVLLGNGDGTFQAVQLFSIGGASGFSFPTDVVVGDLDGDGAAEVLTANADGGTMTLFRKSF